MKKRGMGGVAQAVEHLLCKPDSPEFKPVSPKKKKKTKRVQKVCVHVSKASLFSKIWS
jgi:hypothetical protein